MATEVRVFERLTVRGPRGVVESELAPRPAQDFTVPDDVPSCALREARAQALRRCAVPGIVLASCSLVARGLAHVVYTDAQTDQMPEPGWAFQAPPNAHQPGKRSNRP